MGSDRDTEPLLLALETSTAVCSLALQRGDTLLALSETYVPQLHSRVLTVLVEQQLRNLGIPFSQLAGVALAAGPGSYTGLRVATSAAKGYCQALGIPLVAVPTLSALAARVQSLARQLGGRIRPLLDARRQEVYTASFSPEVSLLTPYAPTILRPDSFAEELAQGPVVFLGDGAEKARAVLIRHPQAYFFPDIGCSAVTVARLGMERLRAGRTEPMEPFEPFYGKTVRVGPDLPNPQLSESV